MKRNKSNLTLALCTSLIVHGLGLSALLWWMVWTTPLPREAALDRQKVLLAQMSREVEQPLKPQPKITPSPKPEKKPPHPVLAEKYEKPVDELKDDSGEHNGIGTANRSSHGEKPMQAAQGLEQAALMKKDAEKFNPDAFLPASAGKTDESKTAPQTASKVGEQSPDPNADANGKDDPSKRTALAMTTNNGTIPVPKLDSGKPNNPRPSGEKNPTEKSTIAQPINPKSDLKEVRGKKLETSDTESVAFAKAPSLMFVAGHLEGRKGLRVQTKEPRYHDSSEVDMESLGYPRTLLGVKVDADGNVLDVTVLESSGSTNIDLDRKRAVWDWILEPEKDKDGHVTDDHWTIALR